MDTQSINSFFLLFILILSINHSFNFSLKDLKSQNNNRNNQNVLFIQNHQNLTSVAIETANNNNNLKINANLTNFTINSSSINLEDNMKNNHTQITKLSKSSENSNNIFEQFSFCSNYGEFCYSDGLIVIISKKNWRINNLVNKSEIKLRSPIILGESGGISDCNFSSFKYNTTLQKIKTENKKCYTAGVGEFTYVAKENDLIENSNHNRICEFRANNKHNLKKFFLQTNQTFFCNGSLFNDQASIISKDKNPDNIFLVDIADKTLNSTINVDNDGLAINNLNNTKNQSSDKIVEGCFCSNLYKTNWNYCSAENVACEKPGIIRYGYYGSYIYKYVPDPFICDSITLGQVNSKNSNYCWVLSQNSSNTRYYNYNEKILVTEEYQACSISINEVKNFPIIFKPNSNIICTTQDFNTGAIANLNTALVQCECSTFIN